MLAGYIIYMNFFWDSLYVDMMVGFFLLVLEYFGSILFLYFCDKKQFRVDDWIGDVF